MDGETTGITPFVLPPDALTPQLPAPDAAPSAPAAADAALDDLFGPPLPSLPLAPGAEFLAGTGLETLEAPPANYDRRFCERLHPLLWLQDLARRFLHCDNTAPAANLRPSPPPLPVSDNPWAGFAAIAPAEPAKASRGDARRSVQAK